MKDLGMIKAYVGSSMKEYIELLSKHYGMSVSRMIYFALNSPQIYEDMVNDFRNTKEYADFYYHDKK